MKLPRFGYINRIAICIALLSAWVLPSYADLVSPRDLYHHAWQTIKEKYYDTTLREVHWDELEHKYDAQMSTIDDAHKYIREMISTIDDPTIKFLSPEEYAEDTDVDRATIVGIGINLMRLSDKADLVITRVIDGSPAQKAGVKAGDRILKVDNMDVAGKGPVTVSKFIRGVSGSTVTLTVKRENETKVIPVIRTEIKVKSVTTKITPQGIGIIYLHTLKFSSVPAQFREAVEEMRKATYLVIDVQDNDGGSLPNAIKIANMLLEKGTIATTDIKGVKQVDTASGAPLTQQPILLLVNEETTAEAEVLAAALKDNGRAFVLGAKTGGRGLARAIIKLPDGSGVKLPVGRYLTPKGEEINRFGIEPNTVLKSGLDKKGNLDAAMDYLSKKLNETSAEKKAPEGSGEQKKPTVDAEKKESVPPVREPKPLGN